MRRSASKTKSQHGSDTPVRHRNKPLVATIRKGDAGGDTSSLDRGFAVLRAFRSGEKTLSIADVAQRLSIRKALAQSLVDTLVSEHLLRRVGNADRYQPDVGCFLLGHAWLAVSEIVQAARPTMQQFAKRYGLNIVLGTHHDLDMICIESCSNLVPGQTPGTVGLTVPVTATALGRAWLWAQPAVVQGDVIQRTKVERGEVGVNTIPGVYRAFQEMEEFGYCYSSGEWMKHVSAIGTVIVLKDGTSYGLCCDLPEPGIDETFLRTDLGPAFLKVALQIKSDAEQIKD